MDIEFNTVEGRTEIVVADTPGKCKCRQMREAGDGHGCYRGETDAGYKKVREKIKASKGNQRQRAACGEKTALWELHHQNGFLWLHMG